MSAHVLLNLLNLMLKSENILSKPHILLLSSKFLNKFNKTGTPMLDSIYKMTLRYL